MEESKEFTKKLMIISVIRLEGIVPSKVTIPSQMGAQTPHAGIDPIQARTAGIPARQILLIIRYTIGVRISTRSVVIVEGRLQQQEIR